MIHEITKDIYCIKVRLPENVLNELNAYVVRGDERSLLIDTGFDMDECEEDIMRGLAELGIEIGSVDVFITHMHPDHSGLLPRIAHSGMKLYYNELCRLLFEGHSEDELMDLENFFGIPDGPFLKLFAENKNFTLSVPDKGTPVFLTDGSVLNYGEYSFEYLYTPGHCEDHGCLYDRNHKLIICGDLVLGDITPSINDYSAQSNNLSLFLSSLDRVKKLDVDTVCPGHRNAFDFRRRIEEIEQHHAKRLEETLGLISDTPQTIAQLAPQLAWHAGGGWSTFSLVQKFFAIGEAAAHVQQLYSSGQIQMLKSNGVCMFYKKDTTGELI